MALLERHEPFVGHFAQLHLPAAGQPMAARNDESRAADRRRGSSQSRHGRAAPPRKSDPARRVRAALRPWRCCSERKQTAPPAGRRLKRRTSSGMYRAPSVRRNPSAMAPRSAALKSRELAAAVVDLAERALHPRQEQLAGLGQADRTAGAAEQLHAEVGLQPRQRRLNAGWLVPSCSAARVTCCNRPATRKHSSKCQSVLIHPRGSSNSCIIDIYLA